LEPAAGVTITPAHAELRSKLGILVKVKDGGSLEV